MAVQNYLSFDFKNFNEKGLKKVTKAFEKNDLMVTDIEATNKATRQSGYPTKKASFVLADGQKIILHVKGDSDGDGSIFKVQLNSRVIPVTNVNSMTKAIKEISDKAKANSPQFQRAMRRKMKKPKVEKQIIARTSTKARIALYHQQAQELQTEVDQLEERKQELTTKVSDSDERIDTLKGQIAEAKAENERLQVELVDLDEAA